MFEMQSVLQAPESSKKQLAALAAFFHLTVAGVLLVGLAWRIDAVEAPNLLEAYLPVAFLPAEWSAPLVAPTRVPSAPPVEKTPAVVQPKEIGDVPPAPTLASLDSEAIAPLSEIAGPGAESIGATNRGDVGGVGEGDGTPFAAASIVWHPGIVPPKVLFRLDPKYPEVARVAHRQGAVVIEAEIATDGTLRSARVVSSPLGFGLEQSALEAIGSWRFAPARYGDRPVAVYYRWNILFSLR
jgi:protein TonB